MKTSIRSWIGANYASIDKLVEQLDSLTFSPRRPTGTTPAPLQAEEKDPKVADSNDQYYRKYAEQLKDQLGMPVPTTIHFSQPSLQLSAHYYISLSTVIVI